MGTLDHLCAQCPPTIDTLVQLDDVSRGAEPVHVSLTISPAALEVLDKSFTYISDSVFPNGTSIEAAARCYDQNETGTGSSSTALRDTGRVSDSGSISDDTSDLEGCECSPSQGACSLSPRGDCDCVAAFGNFYRSREQFTETAGILDLDALPDHLPLVECGSSCSCSLECDNRITQRGVRIPISVRLGANGIGLAAYYAPSLGMDLAPGTFVTIYAGEYLSSAQARERWALHDRLSASPSSTPAVAAAGPAPLRGTGNYTLSLRSPTGVIHIDARHRGNVARFLNHSCDPNCVMRMVWWGGGPPRSAIFAKRLIHSGEELTYDYGDASGTATSHPADADGQSERESCRSGLPVGNRASQVQRTRCLCGAAACRGWMPFDDTL